MQGLIRRGKTDKDFYVFQTAIPESSPELLLVGEFILEEKHMKNKFLSSEKDTTERLFRV